MSRLDVVVFGASGFTGRHAVERLVDIAGRLGLTWGVAGRSREKLLQVIKDISDKTGTDLSSTPVLIADVGDEQSLRDVCSQARVLVNCCGPYALWGEPVVSAAIHSKTHYVDISAEPNFNELMHLKYDKLAREAGVYVVIACGFESIPVDLGVVFLQQRFGGVLNSVDSYLTGGGGDTTKCVNFGTWHSMVDTLPYFFSTPSITKKTFTKPLPTFTPKTRYWLLHKRLGGWCLPFPAYDCTAVYRTQRYFYEKDGTRPAQFQSYVKLDSLFYAFLTSIVIVFIFVMSQFKFTRNLIIEKASVFSLGVITNEPSESAIKNTDFEFKLYGHGWDESDAANVETIPPRKTVIAKVGGANPGYGATVVALLFAAVAILREPQHMPPGGGVMSPGTAFANTGLIKNLQDNGIYFQIEETKLHQE